MRQFYLIRKRMPLILLISVLMLCLGFILVNCGLGPQQKVLDPEAGQFAVNFLDCSSTGSSACRVVIDSEVFESEPGKQIGGKEITLEAWIKPQSATKAGIFGRMNSAGAALFLGTHTASTSTEPNTINPKFVIRRVVNVTAGTSTAEYVLDSLVDISSFLGQWVHLAAVVVNEDHSSVHASCGGVESNTPHMDFYVNGVFRNCAATFGGTTKSGEPDPTAASVAFAGEPFPGPTGQHFNLLYVGTLVELETAADSGNDGGVSTEQFPGSIDEPRLWGVARTVEQIQACMNQELGFDSGTCGRRTDNLIGYFRFNEGTGSSTNERSGLGSAVKEFTNPAPPPPALSWTTGWTADTPSLTAAD